MPQTGYTFNAGNEQYKNATLNNIIHKCPAVNGSNTKAVTGYWLASRCTETNGSASCNFRVSVVGSSGISTYFLFISTGTPSGYEKSVRPIITLNSGIQAEYVGQYNSTYNTWTIN